MTCGKCQTDNAEGTVFCVKCGTRLPRHEQPAASIADGDVTPAVANKPWYATPMGILNWCLGRDRDDGVGVVESRERDERGRIQFECVSCHGIVRSPLPEACPHCGRALSGTPSRAASMPPPSATPRPTSEPPITPETLAAVTPHPAIEAEDPAIEPDRPNRSAHPRRRRTAWIAAGVAASVVLVAVVSTLAATLPAKATKRAFAELRAADEANVGSIHSGRIADAYPDTSTATKEWLKQLNRVLLEIEQNRPGGWVASGRLLKYASALETSPSDLRTALSSVRERMDADNEMTDQAGRALRALEIIRARYAAWPLKGRALAALASKLGVAADRSRVSEAVQKRYAEAVARDQAQAAARVAADQARRDADIRAQAEQKKQEGLDAFLRATQGDRDAAAAWNAGGSTREAQLRAQQEREARQAAAAGTAGGGAGTGGCPACGGTGKCSTCAGMGRLARWGGGEASGTTYPIGSPTGVPGDTVKACWRCSGTGKCPNCGGEGSF